MPFNRTMITVKVVNKVVSDIKIWLNEKMRMLNTCWIIQMVNHTADKPVTTQNPTKNYTMKRVVEQ